jgi:hypothetical protein
LIQQNPVTHRDKPYAFNGSDRLSRPDKNLIAPAIQNSASLSENTALPPEPKALINKQIYNVKQPNHS